LPVFNFAVIIICLYIIQPPVFCRPLSRLPWGLLLKTYFSITIHSMDMTNPIQPTYSDKWE
jgi:hypothetical protein